MIFIKFFVLIFVVMFTRQVSANVYSGTCGEECSWSVSDGTLKIIGTIQNYGDGGKTPWRILERDNGVEIKNVDASEVTGLGKCSFEDLRNVTGVVLPRDITNIPPEAFRFCESLENLELPENISSVGYAAFTKMYNLKSITIPDSAVFNYSDVFEETSGITTVYCKGDIETCRANLEITGIADSVTILTAPETQCNGANYYWSGNACNKRPTDGRMIDCADGWYVTNFDTCAIVKKRYTLPEADAATSNDNENTIEWIFE